MIYARIAGTGSFLPGSPVSNDDLVARGIDTSDEWIVTRSGIRVFWASHARTPPQLRLVEALPIAMLLCASIIFTVRADNVMRFTQATANMLHSPGTYISAVMSARPEPSPAEKKAASEAAAEPATPPTQGGQPQ